MTKGELNDMLDTLRDAVEEESTRKAWEAHEKRIVDGAKGLFDTINEIRGKVK